MTTQQYQYEAAAANAERQSYFWQRKITAAEAAGYADTPFVARMTYKRDKERARAGAFYSAALKEFQRTHPEA